MATYIDQQGRSAVFRLIDAHGRTIEEVRATQEGLEPRSFGPNFEYPLYEVETAKGITEVIEHRTPGPTFSITDDPEIKARLGLK
jgi:hypothetical protein